MRLVLDPNVLVSAAVAKGVSRRLLDLWRHDQLFTPIVCPMLLDELEAVLRRERFRAVVGLADVEAIRHAAPQ